ncbi:MAG: hypothetical protein IJJ10_03245 [Bacillus sp. (in: Bacteria)]|nr:hypothetical protein [Bacillus sp. (in: firmicutes)]
MNKDLVLIHHGIEGQKWGKRNGPPYPLDYGDHSSAEKKALIDKKNKKKLEKMAYKKGANLNNRNKVEKEFENEIRNLESGKKYYDLNKKRGIRIKDANGNIVKSSLSYLNTDEYDNNTEKLLDLMFADTTVENAFRQDYIKTVNKYIDKYSGALLKDIGYDDTKEGREYIKKIGMVHENTANDFDYRKALEVLGF